MERQPSLRLERNSSLEHEPLTLTKEQYQAALAAVIQMYTKGNPSVQPGGEVQPEKDEAPQPAKGCSKL
ncbi:hypothetical protein QQP08_023207 [Theobroma cacao]|uniref:Uncharacterized protein n=1 Tax=Theobroma cacao TaxID=3641 RepID=A0A061FPY5_THECC|nr:Uncharacterized protein TCM_035404 [Theobroma cacao]WRX30720.1 hypothetical protein QQP08_023207 [Theobroma cacao]